MSEVMRIGCMNGRRRRRRPCRRRSHNSLYKLVFELRRPPTAAISGLSCGGPTDLHNSPMPPSKASKDPEYRPEGAQSSMRQVPNYTAVEDLVRTSSISPRWQSSLVPQHPASLPPSHSACVLCDTAHVMPCTGLLPCVLWGQRGRPAEHRSSACKDGR